MAPHLLPNVDYDWSLPAQAQWARDNVSGAIPHDYLVFFDGEWVPASTVPDELFGGGAA